MPSVDLKEAIEHLVELGQDLSQAQIDRETQFIVHEHNGRPYYKGDYRPMLAPEAEPLRVNTLTAIADYLNDNPDELDLSKLLVHVTDATNVVIRSVPTGPHLQRPVFMKAFALTPDHMFDSYVPPDRFVPYLQSCFAEGGNLVEVIALCGNVTASAEVNQQDDGITQIVTATQGVQRKANVTVPNPVVLYPFSSFVEIEQPARKFVLRFKGSPDSGTACALIPADGGAWQIAAITSISKWLREKLPAEVRIIA